MKCKFAGFCRTEKEKIALQKKLKTTGITVDRVVGVRATETEKEVEELRKRNLELENEVAHMRWGLVERI